LAGAQGGGVAGAGHRHVFWLASDTMDLLFSGGTAAGDADLPLLVAREKAGLWNATASVRVVVVALPQEAAASVAVATALCCDRSVEAGVR